MATPTWQHLDMMRSLIWKKKQVFELTTWLLMKLVRITQSDPEMFITCISFSLRCIWAGRLCVLRVSMSSCWAAGTETASSAHLSPTSTPFLPRTPWTWFDRRTTGRKLTFLLERWSGLVWWRVRSQAQWGLLAFVFCTFWAGGAETPLVRFLFHLRPPKRRLFSR